MFFLRIRRSIFAIVVTLALGATATPVLAGTTGSISGTIVDATTKDPLAGAKVTVASPSQTAGAATDRTGHFVLLNLAPDTYTVTVEYAGYDSVVETDVNVFADQTNSLALTATKTGNLGAGAAGEEAG